MHANLLIVDTMYDELNRFCEKKIKYNAWYKRRQLRLMVDCIALFEYSPVRILLPSNFYGKISMTTHLRSDVVLDNLYSQVQRFSK